jgi:hypothetical protein
LIDINDFKHFEVNSKGKILHSKKYMGYCYQCSGKRGYIFKAEDGKLCRACYRPTRVAILKANIHKGMHIFDMLGYNADQLKKHLESKFKDGMTWDNCGKWQIDHVIPDSWFKYSSIEDEEFKKCWALDNLQPLWADQNRKKSDLYAGPYREEIG